MMQPSSTVTISSCVAASSATLWAIFTFIQTDRHRDYFIPAAGDGDPEAHAAPPSAGQAWASFGLLVVSLVTVVAIEEALGQALDKLPRCPNR